MVRRHIQSRARQVRTTVLSVGDGYSEVGLLKHVRRLYLAGMPAISLSVNNARGKGGRAVLEHAISLQRQHAYDVVAVLVDTDTDWSDTERRRAKQKCIHTLESCPCLEAWLLGVHGENPPSDSAACKRRFEERFRYPAADDKVFDTHFGKAVLDDARQRIEVLDQLLKLIRV